MLHIDAKDKKFIDFYVFNAEQFKKLYSGTGTLSIVDVEEAKKEFWERIKNEIQRNLNRQDSEKRLLSLEVLLKL